LTYHHGVINASNSKTAFPPANSPDNWFASTGPKTISYKMRDLQCPYRNLAACYDDSDADIYTMDFEPKDNFGHAGPVWNILTDRSTIDLTNDPGTLNALHNGYISVNLTRAFIELLYANSP
jgi:hypothetical protein